MIIGIVVIVAIVVIIWKYPRLMYSSDFRVKYHNVIHSDEINPMKEVYNRLQKKFNQQYMHIPSSRVCFCKQKSYYQEIS